MRLRPVLLLLPALLLTAGCGGGDEADQGDTAATPAANEPAAPAPATDAAAPAAGGTVHEVRMVTTQNGASGVFEPATLTVRRGDVIRFVNDGAAAHNANFQTAANAGKPGLPPAMPYLAGAGQSADVTVSWEPGTYGFQCDPHVMTGMVGTLTVQ